MFLVQALEQEKRRILRLLDALAEADAAEDDPTRVVGISAEYALDRIGTSCILGEVVGEAVALDSRCGEPGTPESYRLLSGA